jgi:hypothetical protein
MAARGPSLDTASSRMTMRGTTMDRTDQRIAADADDAVAA